MSDSNNTRGLKMKWCIFSRKTAAEMVYQHQRVPPSCSQPWKQSACAWGALGLKGVSGGWLGFLKGFSIKSLITVHVYTPLLRFPRETQEYSQHGRNFSQRQKWTQNVIKQASKLPALSWLNASMQLWAYDLTLSHCMLSRQLEWRRENYVQQNHIMHLLHMDTGTVLSADISLRMGSSEQPGAPSPPL